jgi:hypothetical protein
MDVPRDGPIWGGVGCGCTDPWMAPAALRDPSATVQQKVEDDLVAKAVDQPPALRGSEGRGEGGA